MGSNKSDTEKLQAAYDLFGSKAGAAFFTTPCKAETQPDDLSGTLGDFSEAWRTPSTRRSTRSTSSR
jgi:hypothetical protein